MLLAFIPVYTVYPNDYMLTLLEGCWRCIARECLQMWGWIPP